MGYASSGKITYSYNVKSTNEKCEYILEFPNEGYGLALLEVKGDSPHYDIYGTKITETATEQQSYIEVFNIYDQNGTIIYTSTSTEYLNKPSGNNPYYSVSFVNNIIENPNFSDFDLKSEFPTFADMDSLENYLKTGTGDDSGAIKDLSTDWKIYIDGEFNPLYKIHWKCKDLPNAMYSYVKFYVGEFDQRTNLIFGKDDLRILYDKNNYKTNYHDLAKIADLDTILGHQSICLIMELQYYDSPTVLPTNTSQYMYCILHYKAIDGKMYGTYGFCELIEKLVWQTTTSGKDNSTINIYDGEDGSKGYTEDNDNGYDDGKDKDDADDDTGDVSSGIGVLTSTFKMTKERLVQLGQFLWSANIFDQFSLINNNPIENIVSCKSIPINTDGTNQEIVLGNVSTGVNGEKISNNFAKQTIGSILINEHYHNFLDYTPYTNVILYLPYIGFKELDTTLVMNKTIQVIYTVDSITGGCLAQVYVNNVRLYEFTGNVGIDIPITASNRAQVEAGYIQAGVGATMSAVGGNVGSAVTSLLNSATSQYHYSSTGNPNPMCVASTNRTCYVIIDRPNYQNLKAFNHTKGRKCYLSKTIGSLHGFTVCDSNIDLSGINATQSELEELKDILSSGFYV